MQLRGVISSPRRANLQGTLQHATDSTLGHPRGLDLGGFGRILIYFGVVLGLFWGLNLGVFLDTFKFILGWFWECFGSILNFLFSIDSRGTRVDPIGSRVCGHNQSQHQNRLRLQQKIEAATTCESQLVGQLGGQTTVVNLQCTVSTLGG